ncbi:MAG: hypothetical protein R6U03_09735 [Gillisia sp.]
MAGIKSLNFWQFFELAKVLILKPLFIFPTYKATRETVKICNSHFGKKHHKNNSTNAFRHALWNFLICVKCYKASNSVEKASNWAEKITSLHEVLSPNSELAKIMDLHNNRIGRELFEKNTSNRISIITVLKEMMENAVQVCSVEEIETVQNRLVFIEKLETQL